ncbi:DUF6112 family protein [Frankia sp. R82]|uniref:DUF6112 family protein n=1 Tax=Frankia sp. R82 TaxID=2950553 RepID=UPI002042C581|nr:DUF6112 family protein [Frankia sp. R82]MCM3885943.1 DUF6112 family protein [Frankia sp. R82]
MIHDAAYPQALVFLAVEVKPDDSKAPGINALKDLVNGLAAYAVIAAVAAVLLGGIAWALGERMGLERASTVGKSGVIAGFGLAFLVGAAAAFINFFLVTGATATAPAPNPGDLRPPAIEVSAAADPGVVHASASTLF